MVKRNLDGLSEAHLPQKFCAQGHLSEVGEWSATSRKDQGYITSDSFVDEKIMVNDCILVGQDFIEKTQQKLDFGGAS